MADMTLAFDVLARDRASKPLSDVERSLSRASRAGSFFGTIAGTIVGKGLAGIASAAISAARGLKNLVTGGFNELFDYQKGLAQLEAGIASTGGVAGVSAAGLEKLAGSLQGLTGQTDDSIVKAEQLLLTFTNIRNSVGAGNDIFTQATKVTTDLAARLGGDASSAAIQLGKALNDPLKGITALSRIGISFSAQQKEQVSDFLKAGKVMEAQKVILRELNKEVGGSAATYGKTLPGQIDRAKRAFEDFQQGIAAALAPAVAKYLPKFTAGLQSLVAKGQELGSRVLPIIKRIGTAIFDFYRAQYSAEGSGALKGLQAIGDAFKRLFQGISGLINPTENDIKTFGTTVGTAMAKVLEFSGRAVAFLIDGVTKAIPVVFRLGAAFADVASKVIEFVRSVLGSLPPVLGAVATVAGALGFDGTAKKLDGAKTAIQNFGKESQASLDGFAQSARNSADAFENAIGRISFAEQRARQMKANLESDDPKVAARAREQLAKQQGAAKQQGTKVGKAFQQGYSVTLPKIKDDAKKAATEAAQAMVDAVQTRFEKAKSHLEAVVSQSLSLRSSITSALQQGTSLADVFSGDDLNANGAFGKQNNFGRVKAFLEKRVAKLRKFVLELRQLMKKGLDPSLIAQIAQAGVDGGQRVAEAILSGGSGAIGTVNGLEKQIASLANTTGKGIADDRYAKQIAAERANTAVLQRELQKANAYLKRISDSGSTASGLRTSAATTGI